MSVSQSAPPPLPRRPFAVAPFAVAVLLVSILLAALHLRLPELFRAQTLTDLGEYLGRYRTIEWRIWQTGLLLMLQTVATGFWGTMLALLLGAIAAPLAVRQLSPHAIVYRIVRETLNIFRALPDFLLTLLFLNALELGPWPAVLALGLHSGANLGKFFSENMERVDKGVYEALRASGAGFLHTTLFAAWPATVREAAGYSLYIFDRNVRMATVLGVVGAGGIGRELKSALAFFKYDYAAMLILIVVTTVFLIDVASNALRRRLA